MPKSGQRAEVNTFIQGLITEASPLNFPPNASKDEENFILKRDGTRHRRLGLDYRPSTTFLDTGLGATLVGKGFNNYTWNSVGGDPTKNFLAVQIGNKVHYFDMDVVSGDGALGSTVLPFDAANTYSFAAIEGRLVIVGGYPAFVVITYDDPTFVLEEQRLMVRDFWGVEVP